MLFILLLHISMLLGLLDKLPLEIVKPRVIIITNMYIIFVGRVTISTILDLFITLDVKLNRVTYYLVDILVDILVKPAHFKNF